MLAVFRADASSDIGGGHVMRCLVLADALAASGWQCGFASNALAPNLVGELNRHDVLAVPPGVDAVTVMRDRWGERWDLGVVDHYGLDAAFEDRMRDRAASILVIDDIHDRPHDCDLLLDQTQGRTKDAYAGLTPKRCKMLLGTRYALLRPAFSALRGKALKSRARRSGINRVLVAFGLTDPMNLTAMAIDVLQGLALEIAVDVVLGGQAPHLESVCRKAAKTSKSVTVHVGADAETVAGLMAGADLALGAPGTSSWERGCLGLPSVLVGFAANQTGIAAALEETGAAVNLGHYETVTPGRLSDTLSSLALDSGRLQQMSEAAAGLCDGHGAARVVEAISNNTGKITNK